jgi:hypothetical protein
MKKVYKKGLIYHIANTYGNLNPYHEMTICDYRKAFISGLGIILGIVFIASYGLISLIFPLIWLLVQIQYDWILPFGEGPEILGLGPVTIFMFYLTNLCYNKLSNIEFSKSKKPNQLNDMYSSLVEKFCYPIEFKEKNDE